MHSLITEAAPQDCDLEVTIRLPAGRKFRDVVDFQDTVGLFFKHFDMAAVVETRNNGLDHIQIRGSFSDLIICPRYVEAPGSRK